MEQGRKGGGKEGRKTADRKAVKDKIGKCVSYYRGLEKNTENRNTNIGFIYKLF